MVLERSRHLQEEKKKFTWESLEKMNLNELRGITNINFEPEKFIGDEDEEDKLYMNEFSLNRKDKGKKKEKLKLERQIQNYGDIKKKTYYSPKIQSRYRQDIYDPIAESPYFR